MNKVSAPIGTANTLPNELLSFRTNTISSGETLALAQSRKIKKKEQIEALMSFIDAKMGQNIDLNQAKLQLINCQLCSMA